MVGAGQAGVQAALSLRHGGFDGAVTVIGDEPELPYQRPPLSKEFLADPGQQPLPLRAERFYDAHDIRLLRGERVVTLDRAAREVHLGSGGRLAFDHLVLALGARNRTLPVPGHDADGVLTLRTLRDAERLRDRLAGATSAVVVGGGFIGLEFASVARARGIPTLLVEAGERTMARAVSPAVSGFLTAGHRRAGVRILLGTTVRRLLARRGRVVGVETDDGRRHPADLVLVAVGAVPNVGLAAGAGLPTADGILVDACLRTPDPRVFAVGDCARYPSPAVGSPVRLESVQNAADHGRCVAETLLRGQPTPYRAVPWFWSDQGELRLQIAGVPTGAERAVLRGDPDAGAFSVFSFVAGRLVAVESVNRPADHLAARRLLADGRPLTPEQAADPSFDLRSHSRSRPEPGPPAVS
ncbi:NAD(P)/FAD-dependent oxidoreductase [Frankia sp. QA3]|uniref:NAD(P)/FAD-dependent oxidoreductase n=1 Tax=Frankia sp. QA3 TaxID=710111 RepID=UPI000269BF86|nr:FAD-dependent oxidoreductase [Frankia sp. QA3]EIV92871.1 NAD(P)H-nitrite reductase [Frankia sp. QA3]